MSNSHRYTISRIDDFNLDKRPFLSGIFGPNTDDVFIDSDLRRCTLDEILFRSFKAQGYNVVFYNTDPKYNFYSFSQEDLLALFSHLRKTTQPSAGRYHANIASPFAHRRKAHPQNQTQNGVSASGGGQNEYRQIQSVANDNGERYFRIANDVDPFDVILSNADKRIAVIFNHALEDEFPHQDTVDTKLRTVRGNYYTRKYGMKIIAVYMAGREAIFDGKSFFCAPYFLDAIVGTTDKEKLPDPERNNLFNIQSPDKEEFRNMLNRFRLMKGYESPFGGNGIEKLSIALSQRTNNTKDKDLFNYERISSYESLTKDSYKMKIKDFNTEDSKVKLEKLVGIDAIRNQFYAFLETYREAKKSNRPFRPHMAFMGNPGTGKTTVARIFADILRVEGVLERGHLVQATVGDMVAGHVGQTRIKTQELCDRARGGVLFIDEAYGLMSGKNEHGNADFGEEAIEVLIQFMENNSDSLVILAGYTNEIEDLLKNGNKGFESRIQKEGRFIFEDYSPDVLYRIFLNQFKGETLSDEFKTQMQRVISVLHARRNLNWGNAREMENLASEVLRQHLANKKAGEYTTDDIPDRYKLLISPDIDIDSILQDINEMTGLSKVKAFLTDLLMSAAGERNEAEQTGVMSMDVRDLNFVFLGNPGTGKTTVAKKLARILFECGLIAKSTTVEKKIGDIVSSVQGQTAKNIDKLFKEHTGEVIFIDEAYELARQGEEAITPLISILTDDRYRGKQAIVLAGYTDDMKHLMSLNSGFQSRFSEIEFEDYTDSELVEILLYNMSREKTPVQFSDSESCKHLAKEWFKHKRETVAPKDFGNARLCGHMGLLAILQANKRNRLKAAKIEDKEAFAIIRPEDFPNYGPREE